MSAPNTTHEGTLPSFSAGWRWWHRFLLGLMVLWVSLTLLVSPPSVFDEQYYLAQAWRVAQGGVLYQEVWEFISPLPIYLLAGFFAWWGEPNLEGPRLLAASMAALTLWSVARGARLAGAGPWLALLAAGGAAWGSLPVYRAFYHHWAAWALVLLTVVLLAEALRRPGVWLWGLAGVVAAFATLSAQSHTLPLLFLLALALLLRRPLLQKAEIGFGGPGVWVFCGFVLPWLLLATHQAAMGSLGVAWHQMWVWPAQHYRQAGGINDIWPFTDWGLYHYPFELQGLSPWAWLLAMLVSLGSCLLPLGAALGAVVAGAGALWASFRQGWRVPFNHGGRSAWLWACLGVYALLFAVAGRSDVVHLRVAALPAWAIWAIWASHLLRLRQHLPAGLGQSSLALPAVGLALLVGCSALADGRAFRQAWREGKLAFPLTPLSRDSEAMRLVRRLVPPQGVVAVYPGSGVPFLFAQRRVVGHYTVLTTPPMRYHGPEDYQRQAKHWRQANPDLILMVNQPQAKAEAELGPNFPFDWSRYRQVATCHGPPGEQVIFYRFLLRRDLLWPEGGRSEP